VCTRQCTSRHGTVGVKANLENDTNTNHVIIVAVSL
jgi:hypothetical protein